MKQKKDIFDYVQRMTGWKIENKELNVSLPLYIQSGYELWNTSVAGFGVLFAYVKDKNLDMRIHYNAVRKLEENCPSHVVLVFDTLDSRTINRLLEKHKSFVVKEKYIYMPFALMQIEIDKSPSRSQRKFQFLTSDADTILIGYLSGKLTNEMMIKDISLIIKRDIRTTSVALSVLESFKYVQIEKYGRSKRVYFINLEEAYDRLKNEFKTPIKYTFFTDSQLLLPYAMHSGYSALSRYSTVMDNRISTLAISAKNRNALLSNMTECEEDQASYKVEVWDREPSIFAIDDVINPLYVLRILGNEADERTKDALEDIEEAFYKRWKDGE